jgi:hypothetical protein
VLRNPYEETLTGSLRAILVECSSLKRACGSARAVADGGRGGRGWRGGACVFVPAGGGNGGFDAGDVERLGGEGDGDGFAAGADAADDGSAGEREGAGDGWEDEADAGGGGDGAGGGGERAIAGAGADEQFWAGHGGVRGEAGGWVRAGLAPPRASCGEFDCWGCGPYAARARGLQESEGRRSCPCLCLLGACA